jgi:hypothetical protein
LLVTPYPPCYDTAVGWLVKAPARFLLVFLLIWALIALLLVIDVLGTRDVDQLVGSLPIAATTQYALFAGLLPALLLTLVLQLMTLRRSSDHPVTLRVLLFLLSGAILIGGFQILGDSYQGFAGRLAEVGLDLDGDAIYRSEERSLYVSEVQTLRLRNVVLVPRSFGDRMELVGEARYLPGPDREVAQLPGIEEPFSLRDAYGGPWRGPRSSSVFGALLEDFSRLTEDLLRFPPLSRGFLLRIGGVLLVFVTAWVFLRLTRWPLFNAFLFLLTLRGALWLPRALTGPSAQELLQGYLAPELLSEASYVVLLGLSGLFVLINLLLPGLSHWERETLDG